MQAIRLPKIHAYQMVMLLALMVVSVWLVGAESSLSSEAVNHISGLRLQHSLTMEQAESIFTETGELTPEAIKSSTLITRGNRLGNQQLRDILSSKGSINDWPKYSTESIPSPSGNFQMHFYQNSVTGEVYYGMDYKAVFDHQGLWNFEPKPNFDYEPPSFNP